MASLEIKLSVKGLTPALLLNKKKLTESLNLAAKIIGYKKKCTKINLFITDDKTISKFHKKFLNNIYPTDVITFPMKEIDQETGEFILGDLIISKETAIREARLRNIPIQNELTLYAIHGFLHLNGFDDLTAKDRKKMFLLQNKIMRLTDP